MAVARSPRGHLIYTHSFETPIGTLHGAVDRHGRVLALGFAPRVLPPGTEVEENKYACGELEFQVREYFSGRREEFSLDLRLEGTDFQRSVWSRLTKIQFGETATYGEIAQKIGRRNAARAVGNAVAANPVILVVPCHRVLPSSGGIGSFALRHLDGGEGRRVKRLLLDLENHQPTLPV